MAVHCQHHFFGSIEQVIKRLLSTIRLQDVDLLKQYKVMHFTKRQKYFFVFVLTLTRLLRIQSPALYEQQCGFLYVPQESEW